MTAEMAAPTYPIMNFYYGPNAVNELHGYSGEMETAYMRDCLTVLSSDRTLRYEIDTFGNPVQSISFEVRSIDGSRLVENTECREYLKKNDKITGEIVVKDLIDPDQEYMLIFILSMEDGNEIRYYTRLLQTDEYHMDEKLEFVLDFHNLTFHKSIASELTRYLESNAKGDNSTYHKVDIHSSFDQVTWGDLPVEKVTEPVVQIKESVGNIAYLELCYLVKVQRRRDPVYYYTVSEKYRIRYTSDRIYLLDFEREMDQLFDETEEVYVNDKILLGIADEQVQMLESEGGNVLAFVQAGKLYSYHVMDHKIAKLFSFYMDDITDPRGNYAKHDIKILNVDETGNVEFIVYGYMNRGLHEGKVGICVYQYNSMLNTVEEALFIDYDKSYEILKTNVEKLSYINKDGIAYFMLDGSVYAVDLEGKSYKIIVSNVNEGSYQVSDSHQMIVWQEDGELYASKKLVLMNLSTGQKTDISAGYDEYIMPLGFMNDDVIYGLAKKQDVTKDQSGAIRFPMYCLKIADQIDKVLKEYRQNDIYILSCNIVDNQISLKRAVKNDKGQFEDSTDDQIMNTEKIAEGNNILSAVVTEDYKKIVQIQLKAEIKKKSVKVLTPKEVLFEGNREIKIGSSVQNTEEIGYYVYTLNGIEGIYLNPGNAISKAFSNAGVVTDSCGQYVWTKSNRSGRNQIMAITAPEQCDEGESLERCLNEIFKLEGSSINASFLLERGDTVLKILEDNIPGGHVLNLTGCSLETILYYVDRDIPVLVLLNNTKTVLVTGFNDSQIVIFDPSKGALYKMDMDEAELWFSENGSEYITYLRT